MEHCIQIEELVLRIVAKKNAKGEPTQLAESIVIERPGFRLAIQPAGNDAVRIVPLDEVTSRAMLRGWKK